MVHTKHDLGSSVHGVSHIPSHHCHRVYGIEERERGRERNCWFSKTTIWLYITIAIYQSVCTPTMPLPYNTNNWFMWAFHNGFWRRHDLSTYLRLLSRIEPLRKYNFHFSIASNDMIDVSIKWPSLMKCVMCNVLQRVQMTQYYEIIFDV